MKILWIPHTSWHIPQRAHLFCHPLSEHHEIHVTDWQVDFYSLRDYATKRYIKNFTYRRYKDGNIIVHGIPRISPALFIPVLRHLNTAIYRHYANRIIEQYKIDIVVSTFVVPPPKAPKIIFDLFDDNGAYWRSFGRLSEYADEIEQTELAYIRDADAVVAASSVLFDKVKSIRNDRTVHLIPNGVDLKKFENSQNNNLRKVYDVPGFLVGSVGNHDKPGELNMIIGAAQILSDEKITFLIAGRGSAVPSAIRKARQMGLTNIIFTGFIQQDKIAEVISSLDVGLCPYMNTPGANAGSPMRLLLYLAAGLPVVCTNLEEVRRMNFPNIVLVGDDPQALTNGIRMATQLKKERCEQIYEYDLSALTSKWEDIMKSV